MTVQNHSNKVAFRRYKLAIYLAMFLTMISAALAVNEVSVTDKLAADGSLHETLSIALTSNVLPNFELGLPETAQNVRGNGQSITPVNGSVSVPLSCTNCQVKIEYDMSNVVKKESGETYSFSRTINIPTPTFMSYSVYLPEGYVIQQRTGDPPIVPQAAKIETDGTHIIVVWNEVKPELPKRYFVSYQYHENLSLGLELSEWPVWILVGIGIVAGTATSLLIHKRAKKRIEEAYVPSSVLSPDEKLVVEILQKSGTENQREIVRTLGWSKSKVSAVITNLVYKQIVQKEKQGRNYKVELIKQVDKA